MSTHTDESINQEIIERYRAIKSKVPDNVTLVAVSKTKPTDMIRILYEIGHRDFGENYIQELQTKSEELENYKDIKWHFIGSIQSNKIKQLSSIKNLYVIETVEKFSTAEKLAKSNTSSQPINIMVQVNTSGEDSKSGCNPSESLELVRQIITNPICKDKVLFKGLMTIGNPNATKDQPDFRNLVECKEKISKELNIPLNQIDLSMGMSHDFIEAIEFGSTSVRVGSAIFGERDYSKQQK